MPRCASVGAKTRSAKEAIEFGGMMNTIKKSRISFVILAAICAVVLCFSMSACVLGDYTPAKKEAQLKTPDILENGKLKVGVDFGNPPMAGETSKPSGIDVDVASAIADDLGLEVEFVDVGTSPDLALSNKKADIVMGVSSTMKAEEIWKSDAYIKTAPALFAKDSSLPIPVKGGADKFSTEMGSVSAIACQEQFDAANIKLENNLSASFQALDRGDVKYVAADAIIGTYGARQEQVDATIIALLTQPGGYCIGAAKDKEKLIEKIKGSLENLDKGGILSVIERSWMGKNLELDKAKFTAEGASKPAANDADGVYGSDTKEE